MVAEDFLWNTLKGFADVSSGSLIRGIGLFRIRELADKALKQIEDKKYEQELINAGGLVKYIEEGKM